MIFIFVISILFTLQQHLLVTRYQQSNHQFRLLEDVLLHNEIVRIKRQRESAAEHTIETESLMVKIIRNVMHPEHVPEIILIHLEEKMDIPQFFEGIDRVVVLGFEINGRTVAHAVFYREYPTHALWSERIPSDIITDWSQYNE